MIDSNEIQKLLASDGNEEDSFGFSVSIDGNTAVVGASEKNAAYVFEFNTNTSLWEEKAKLTPDSIFVSGFGISVSISGDTVVVGEPTPSPINTVYVYVKPTTGWVDATENARLTASDGAMLGQFGLSVAIDADTIVVGSPEFLPGSGYVYVKPVGGWAGDLTQNAKLTASDGTNFNRFGYSVSIDKNTIVIGSPGADSHRGATYIFEKPAAGWVDASEDAKLTLSNSIPSDSFGVAVSIRNNTIVVGMPLSGTGSAYVYTKPSINWATTSNFNAKLTNADMMEPFGGIVDISGDTIVVGLGIPFFSFPVEETRPGAAYVFIRPDAGWGRATNPSNLTENIRLLASDGVNGDLFGKSVAISEDSIIVGAPGDEVNGHANQGAAYIFRKNTGFNIKPVGGSCTCTTRNGLVYIDCDPDKKCPST